MKAKKVPSNSELLNRNTLETHKLDLMAESSNLKLKLATSENERKDLEDKYNQAQKRIEELQSRLNDRAAEVADLRSHLGKNGTITNGTDCTEGNQVDADLEEIGGDTLRDRTIEREKTLDRLKRKHTEVEKLKKAVESLMVANDEKEKHIDELRKMLKRYKKIEDLLLTSHGRKALENLGIEDDRSSTSSTQNSTSSAENPAREGTQGDKLEVGESGDQFSRLLTPSATSTPVNSYSETPKGKTLPHPGNGTMTPPSAINYMTTPTPKRQIIPIKRSNSAENLSPLPSKTPPTVRRREIGYGTLPERSSASKHKDTTNTVPRKSKGFASFAKTEAEEEALKDALAQEYKALQAGGGDQKKKKGFKRFFGRLRRSSSQDLDDERMDSFKRAGLRATAGPRLGWSRDLRYTDIDVPFARWDGDRVAAWMHSIGLSMYVGDCKRWVKNGDQLLRATPHDLEKELCMRNHFHRKKLQLSLQAIGSDSHSQMDDLDHNWVTRWLDDIGLPQYKDHFHKAMIDGRMLNYLTVDDLASLGVINALHHLSIKRGIQALRINKFNPICLKRRPTADEGNLQNCPAEVLLWTNHRVMEWLRTIDLSEYAPNLRGSGVHGGLMVLEPRFGSEIFASILSIPSTKTLLRRHLHTHFVALIGNTTQARKREHEAQAGYVPLTPNQKVKWKKFGLFNHRRTRSDTELEDYICPLELQGKEALDGLTNGTSSTLPKKTEKSEVAAKEIGAFSHEINTLTTMLAKDQFLDDVPTSNV
jgi:hypothetical protein